ncbi:MULTISPECIES: DMT family transporter [unclassified Pseudodesulfovibrio]|uniref:DMT family transporter n=1 Tax=unclassified Pseudodesulfovibrio TaxID=2661612 RepID=UPI000FEC1085|nr:MULTISPECIES: DMT family transporter [unclassified Pseudodesulfovibrio]MCJ2166131.1 DMT family transporter [Pseudodesulfovibrio sp. S3-i]RWU02424.1 DMT family transporter [Pseudodesulfovibrio sp. S3]
MNILTLGMRYMLVGTILFSIGSLLIKVAGTRLPTMEILFVRGAVGVGFCWVILRRAGVGMFGTRKLMLFLRGLLGFSAMFADFYAIVHLPLADALVLLFSFPVVVAVLAWLLMGEKITKGGAFSILASLVGVTLVCRPGFLFGGASALDPLAVTVALISVVLTSGAILTVRTLAKTEPPAVVMLYPPIVIALFAPLFAQGWVVPNLSEWVALIGVGLFMNAGQYYMTKGYAIESAARISGVSCLEIVFAAFWGMLFLGEVPNLWTIGGGTLIVFGVLVLGRTGVLEQAKG